jgi:pimeloyl-ACP methyl ester carboxylesterase
MEDYVYLINNLKNNAYNFSNNGKYKESPVILFGAGYGGMLAAWMRMKYPNVFTGAVVSSAQITFFDGAQNFNKNAFMQQITKTFGKYQIYTP